MRKFLTVLCTAVLLCTSGCTNKQADEQKAMMTSYKNYFTTVSENTAFRESSSYYDVRGEMSQVADGSYCYYVVIDNPKIAMYNVTALIVDTTTSFDRLTKMMPCVGIFDSKVNMIPFQANAESGFAKGIVLSGESDSDHVNVKLVIEWTDRKKENTTREFLSFELDVQGVHEWDGGSEEENQTEEESGEANGETE